MVGKAKPDFHKELHRPPLWRMTAGGAAWTS
jgi:hypothetical protein